MAHPGVEAIQLSSITAPSDSILIPLGPARVYQNLVKLTRSRLGTNYPQSGFNVHFHLSREDVTDDSCEAQIDEEFYDMGEYFTMRSVQRGRLSLYAHFVNVKNGSRQSQSEPAVTAPREATPANVVKNESESELDRMLGSNYPTAIELDDSPPPQKRPRIRGNVSQNFPNVPTVPRMDKAPDQGTTVNVRREREVHATSSAENYPALSVDATQAQFGADFQAILERGPSEDSRHVTKKDFAALSQQRKRVIANALLIDTDLYGVLASQPCRSCVTMGLVCRIYLPGAQKYQHGQKRPSSGRMGLTCSMCRSHPREICNAA